MKAILFGLLLTLAVAVGNAAQEPPIESTNAVGHSQSGRPIELSMHRAGSAKFDLRKLPLTKPRKQERPELEEPEPNPIELPGGPQVSAPVPVPGPSAPAPAPTLSFDGLDFATWGAGHPPDTNGDVGPSYYIQTINTSIGIYRKSDQVRVAAFTFNTFMSQGAFGNLCDTNNFGDPVVLYDTFEDRWIITDFAFQLDGGGNVVNPPGAFQCFAVSQSGDPVSGGWNFYSINIAGGLGDYPKFGIWPDGLYMSANVFGYPSGAAFQNPRLYAFNKAQMYAGSPTVQIVSFNAPSADFTVLPSNARLQTGTPPAGTPNYFVSTWQFTNALTVYKFHVDWNSIASSTFTGPDTPLASTAWPNAGVPNAPSLGGNSLDVLQIRAMVQNQYSNIGGTESLWTTHTVRRQNTAGFAAPRWYQVNVTGGTVAANLPQATTWDPDGANVLYRFVPSVAVDRAGDLALGYSTSSSATKPAIKYAGRLAGDPINTFSQTEQLLFQGAGTQTGNCGSGACIRWGDYSAMTLDPDGCTFWYTNEYYAVDGLNHQTRIGSFSYPSCTPLGAGGTVSGTVTQTPGGAPLAGATVTLGSRSATTDGSGFYSFTPIPEGTYPGMTASFPGCTSGAASNIVVTDSNTTTQDFALAAAAGSACLTDTTQSDFLAGVATNLDLNTTPGDVTLTNAPLVDQSNTAGTTTGTGFGTPNWTGQTFIPAVTGLLARVDIPLFCNGCTGTTPNLTLSVRATSAGLPTGADLVSATLPGFSNGSATTNLSFIFGSPATLTSGTQYALILRPAANPSVGGYFWIRSSPSTYASGSRVLSADSGGTWSADSTRDYNFKAYMQTGFAASGDLISSVKDANPAANYTPTWTTLSWAASTPTNTSLSFQVAASNSQFGPFNFVGPDNTAATFFITSGSDLSQFNGSRYLKYRSYLATTDGTVTPIVSDVTTCYVDNPPADLAITNDDGLSNLVPGQPVTYTITASNAGPGAVTGATVADSFPASLQTCSWTCAGAGGTCTASGSGNINDTAVNLPVGASVTYSATCTVDPAIVTGGSLSNTATVSAPAFVVDAASGNNSFTDTDNVVNNNTTTTISGSQNPSVFGQSVTFTATVVVASPGTGTPTGSVQFFADAVPVGSPVGLTGGTATLTTATLSVGPHSITATYSGDSSNNGSPGTLDTDPQVVNQASSTTAVTSSLDPSVFGQGVTFTATVTAMAPGAGTPTGNVQFYDGLTTIGAPVSLSGGVATLPTAALAAGAHVIKAIYAGDSNFNGSTGTMSPDQVVNQDDTSTSVASNLNPSVFGQSVTFTATVSPVAPGAGTPTGSVQFKDGAATIGAPVILSGGQATFSTPALAVASHTISAVYTGDSNFNTSTGAYAGNPQVVNKADSNTSVTGSQNPSGFGQSTTFTATVAAVAPGSGTPSGSVQFRDGAGALGAPVSLAGGVATLSTSALTVGSHTITADYAGDGSFNISSGALDTNPQVVDATVGGSISGLSGNGMVLRLTYGSGSTTVDLPVTSGATTFTFASTPLAFGTAYGVTVHTQPAAQSCTVYNGSGTIPASNVTTVVVTCATNTYQIGVTASGLTGSGLAVQLNGANTLAVPAANTTYDFATSLASGSSYVVSINTQPSSPAQLCTVNSPTGTVANAGVVLTISCVAATAALSLSIDDSHLFARYGQVLDYLVTLSNSGNATATNVDVSSATSPGLGAANANWTCIGGVGGATCTASGSGAFADTATLPPNRALTWLVSMPVFGDATDPDVTFTISAPGASDVSDTDTLVIFRDGFNIAYADGTEALVPSPNGAGALTGGASEVFALPAARGNGIIDVLVLHSGQIEAHVQSVTLGDSTLVRVLTRNGNVENASAWARAQIGSTLAIGSVTASDGQHLILLEGAERSLAAPVRDAAQ